MPSTSNVANSNGSRRKNTNANAESIGASSGNVSNRRYEDASMENDDLRHRLHGQYRSNRVNSAPSHLQGHHHRPPRNLVLYLFLIIALAIFFTSLSLYSGSLNGINVWEAWYDMDIPEENLLSNRRSPLGVRREGYGVKNANRRVSNINDDENFNDDDAVTQQHEELTAKYLDTDTLAATFLTGNVTFPPTIFTPVNEQWLHNGRVVRELSHRVLSRNIAQSNVVIVSPDFHNENENSDAVKPMLYPAKIALDQGHTTHFLSVDTSLSSPVWNDHSNATSIGWILLAYFSTSSSTDSTIQNLPSSAIRTVASSKKDTTSYNIDEILSPSRAQGWLQKTTITYIVFPISARAYIPLSSLLTRSSTAEYSMDYTVDKEINMIGLTASKTLLDMNYKLQLLASSHYFDQVQQYAHGSNGAGGYFGEGGDGDWEPYFYRPNALFKSVNEVHRFLYERISRILQVEVENVLQWLHRQQHSTLNSFSDNDVVEVEFHSLLFATQGLDLAIPSRSSYLDVGNHKQCIHGEKGRKRKCDPKLDARALNDTIFLECPKRHESLTVRFLSDFEGEEGSIGASKRQEMLKGTIRTKEEEDRLWKQRLQSRLNLEKENGIIINVNKHRVKTDEDIDLWMGGSSQHNSEAVCVKLGKDSMLPRVSCSTRIIPQPSTPSLNAMVSSSQRPNLVVILIDPLSRQQMKRSLPNTKALLDILGFVEFPKYTAVGNNSGPNQAALYSGMPLEGRDGIRSSNSHGSAARRTWLWDRLNDAGYVTLKAEDGCISNSNMVQSIKPQTHHGEQLHEMFCYDYDRPNCLGKKLAAEHLIDYTRQFINAYNGRVGTPWAAFLSFVDSHEDTLTLISYLDGLLLNFIQDIPMHDDTMIVFTSDHGLHYGPSFQSRSGELERANPILHLRLPSFQKYQRLKRNSASFVTAFDVHETILDVLLGKSSLDAKTNPEPHGISLSTLLPGNRDRCKTTRAIPSNFCSLLDENTKQQLSKGKEKGCSFMLDPPSVFSYYSDIPHSNRPRWPNRCPLRRNHTAAASDTTGHCFCATNERDWFECSNSTMRDEFQKSIEASREHFSLRSCRLHDLDQSLEMNIHVGKNPELVRRKGQRRVDEMSKMTKDYGENEVKTSFDSQPNIIFLEIDSVSLSFSERHFPKTWSLLHSHKIVTEPGKKSVYCSSSWCAGVFNRTSVVGQSSIVNQLAALSGCIDYIDKEEELFHFNKGDQNTYCPTGGGVKVKKTAGVSKKDVTLNHWLFDVASNFGYITFFGEEFCFEDSPYVVQTKSAFSLRNVDLTLEKIFCRLAKDWLNSRGKVNTAPLFSAEHEKRNVPDSCFDGKSRGEIGFEYIRQIWDTYPKLPKFAFLNALAAHDYSLDAAHAPLGSESYDSFVHDFILEMMNRDDSRDTYIVLRSDHGLQGGPWPADFSTQIEHMRPWTAFLAPASAPLDQLFLNQNKLVTGFDIYNSLRYLMAPNINKSKKKSLESDSIGIPPWSYNLFQQQIPSGRNCKDAKVPKEFCPCIEERIDMVPSFYVGHAEKALPQQILTHNWKTMKFEATKLPGWAKNREIQERKYNIMHPTTMNQPPMCNSTIDSLIQEEILRDAWQLIDNITGLFPMATMSGGVFLYPRQTILLSYLIQQESKRKMNVAGPKKTEAVRVCETGFGAGHSSALFLSSAPNVEVVTFDHFFRPYQRATFNVLRNAFGGNRLTRIVGNSCETVPKYKGRCDFLHGSSLCETDNIDLIKLSKPGTVLTSTPMATLNDSDGVYFGPTGQWRSLADRGCVSNVMCFQEEETLLQGNLVFESSNSSISHKFCIAQNTGKCSNQGVHPKTSAWTESYFCKEWRIDRPE